MKTKKLEHEGDSIPILVGAPETAPIGLENRLQEQEINGIM